MGCRIFGVVNVGVVQKHSHKTYEMFQQRTRISSIIRTGGVCDGSLLLWVDKSPLNAD